MPHADSPYGRSFLRTPFRKNEDRAAGSRRRKPGCKTRPGEFTGEMTMTSGRRCLVRGRLICAVRQ
jgi:hypothetical protein